VLQQSNFFAAAASVPTNLLVGFKIKIAFFLGGAGGGGVGQETIGLNNLVGLFLVFIFFIILILY
jgi:hypothetical protein